MASIERRAQSWRVIWRHEGERYRESFASESDAVKFRELLDRNGGHYPDGYAPGVGFSTPERQRSGGRTVADLFGEYVESYKVKPSNRANLRGKFDAMIGTRPIAKAQVFDVRTMDVHDLANDLGRQYAASTVAMAISILRWTFAYGVERGYVMGGNPVQTKMRFESVKPKLGAAYLKRADQEALLAAAELRYRLFYELLLGSGLRLGEALALRVQSVAVGRDGRVRLTVDHSANHMTDELAPTKTENSTRELTLSMPLSAKIAKLADNRDPDERLFVLPLQRDVRHAFTKAVERAGLRKRYPRVRIHDLRHTHASDLIMAGVPLLKVSRRLGHASINVTADIYGHIHADDDALNSELDALAA